MTSNDREEASEATGRTRLPIDGTLDLHAFRPCEVKDLVRDYVAECLDRGILEVRVVHGKGTGALRETVHSTLRRLPEVASFRLAQGDSGGWGATIVVLDPTVRASQDT